MTGRSRYIGFRKEGEYGTAETDPSIRYEDTPNSIQPNLNWMIPEPVAKRAYQKRATGLYRAQGPIGDFDVTPEGIIGDLLMGVFGSEETPLNPETDVYTHEFVPADTIPSYTVRVGGEIEERVLPGCLIEELTLKYKAGAFLKANATVYSGFPETPDTIVAAPTIDTIQPFTQIDDLVNFIVGTDTTAEGKLSELTLTIKNNIPFSEGDLSGNTFSQIRVGQRTVTGTMTVAFDNDDVYDDFIAGTAFDLTATLQGALIGESETYRNLLRVKLFNCQYLRDGTPPIRTQNEILKINAPFQAFYNAGEAREVEAFLQNSITAY